MVGKSYALVDFWVIFMELSVLWKTIAEFEKGTPQVDLRFRNPDDAWKF